jgi:hypothetical protein
MVVSADVWAQAIVVAINRAAATAMTNSENSFGLRLAHMGFLLYCAATLSIA